MTTDRAHHHPSTPPSDPNSASDLADSLMVDAVSIDARMSDSNQPHPTTTTIHTVTNPDDLVSELLDDQDILNHIYNPNRISHLENLITSMRNEMLNSDLLYYNQLENLNLVLNQNQIQNQSTLLPFSSTHHHHSTTQSLAQHQVNSSNAPLMMTGSHLQPNNSWQDVETIAGRPSDLLPIDHAFMQTLTGGRQIALAQSLYEVPVGPGGEFHADTFAASGVDVEMLERDMNPNMPFITHTSQT